MKQRLNVLLAKTDHMASSWAATLGDYAQFFRNKQDAFKGERKTYEPKPGTIDLPSERANKLVVTTVDEKFDWLVDNNKEYLNALFSQERTNSSGNAKSKLVVNGQEWGEFTSLELLRLKSVLENGQFYEVLSNIPVRSDSEEWASTTNEAYKNRKIFESPKMTHVKKSTLKESYILEDPNIAKVEGAKYTPQLAQKDTIVELGDQSHQRFSGEWSHRQRADLLTRRGQLLLAVVEALKTANEAEVQESQLSAERLFKYLLDIK